MGEMHLSPAAIKLGNADDVSFNKSNFVVSNFDALFPAVYHVFISGCDELEFMLAFPNTLFQENIYEWFVLGAF